MTLKNTGEAILISPYGYSRVKKIPYYQDKLLKPMAEEIINKPVKVQSFRVEQIRSAATQLLMNNNEIIKRK